MFEEQRAIRPMTEMSMPISLITEMASLRTTLGFCTNGEYLEPITGFMAQQTFRHLASGRVSGA
jgi:hypothetical protein